MRIFFSYSNEDRFTFRILEMVEWLELFDDFEEVYYYERDAPKGFSFDKYMTEFIEKSDTCLLFCSKNSATSQGVIQEIGMIKMVNKNREKPINIIPIYRNTEDIMATLNRKDINGVFFDINFDLFLENLYFALTSKRIEKIDTEEDSDPNTIIYISWEKDKKEINLQNYLDSIESLIAENKLESALYSLHNLLIDTQKAHIRSKRMDKLILIISKLKKKEEIISEYNEFKDLLRKIYDNNENTFRKLCYGYEEELENEIVYEDISEEMKLRDIEMINLMFSMTNMGLFGDVLEEEYNKEEKATVIRFVQDLKKKIGIKIKLKEKASKNDCYYSLKDGEISVLVIQKKKLSRIPESIFLLEKLKILDLSSNNIGKLPETINNLKNLHELRITKNKLQKLPSSLGDITSLKIIDVSYNRITVLPASIGNLKSLRYMNVAFNSLVTIPDTIVNLDLLEEIDLSNNNLVMFPENLMNLKKLRSINTQKNKIEMLPDAVFDFKKRGGTIIS